jgi:hypothetical protein
MEKTKFQELINVQSKLKQYKKQKKRGVNKLAAAIGVVSAIGGAGILGHQFMQKRKLQTNQREEEEEKKTLQDQQASLERKNAVLLEEKESLRDMVGKQIKTIDILQNEVEIYTQLNQRFEVEKEKSEERLQVIELKNKKIEQSKLELERKNEMLGRRNKLCEDCNLKRTKCEINLAEMTYRGTSEQNRNIKSLKTKITAYRREQETFFLQIQNLTVDKTRLEERLEKYKRYNEKCKSSEKQLELVTEDNHRLVELDDDNQSEIKEKELKIAVLKQNVHILVENMQNMETIIKTFLGILEENGIETSFANMVPAFSYDQLIEKNLLK